MQGLLSVVATPIGNLKDITLRALETLRASDIILCEDTRVTSKLLAHYEIKGKSLMRCDERAERKIAEKVIGLLKEGKRVALVSDSGTPAISDPGAWLITSVREAAEALRLEVQSEVGPVAFKIEVIPGPSSLTAALALAGLSDKAFTFLGFLPHKKGRQTALKEIAKEKRAIVLFESPHRILKLLGELAQFAPEKKVAVAKELTKIHEAVFEGAPLDVIEKIRAAKADRGEFVVIVRS